MDGFWEASLLFAALCCCTSYEAVPRAELEYHLIPWLGKDFIFPRY